MPRERRHLEQDIAHVETRMDGETRHLEGYAAVFFNGQAGSQYDLIPGQLIERIMPGAFDATLREHDIRCLFNHDPSEILGRNRAGTLALTIDENGLRYSCQLPSHSVGMKVAEAVTRRDVTGCSIGMDVQEQRWIDNAETGVTIREIIRIKLWDVGPVTFPAYEGTEVDVRSVQDEAERYFKRQRDQARREKALRGLKLASLK